MRLWLIPALVIGLLLGGPSGAQALWGGAEYGMSVQDTRQAIPKALPIEGGDKLANGAVARLRSPDVTIAGKQFDARFFYSEDSLKQVTLSLVEGATAGQADLIFDSVVTALRSKYGAEIAKDEQGGPMRVRDYTWMSGKTNISAVLFVVGDMPPLLNISYQVRVAQDADNL